MIWFHYSLQKWKQFCRRTSNPSRSWGAKYNRVRQWEWKNCFFSQDYCACVCVCVVQVNSSDPTVADSQGCFISVWALHNGGAAGVIGSETEHTTAREMRGRQAERNALQDGTAVKKQIFRKKWELGNWDKEKKW